MNMSKKMIAPVKAALFAMWPAVLCACVVLLAAGCGDSDGLAGTSEETNDFAEYMTSSSEHDDDMSSSSSKREKSSSSVLVSSSAKITVLVEGSSSSRVHQENTNKVSSSSGGILGYSSGQNPFYHKSSSSSYVVSSSSVLPSSSSKITVPVEGSSSSEEKTGDKPPPMETNPENRNTLEYYLKLFGLKSGSLDDGVLSVNFKYSVRDSALDGENPPSASATEFEGPWPHKFTKQNIGAIEQYFPNASKNYYKIIAAIKNETLDEKCGLYMFNVYGDGLSAGYIVADVAKDSVKVLDIPAGSCKALSSNDVARFLFYYCGELDDRPEIVHIPLEISLSAKTCTDIKNNDEWVRGNFTVP